MNDLFSIGLQRQLTAQDFLAEDIKQQTLQEQPLVLAPEFREGAAQKRIAEVLSKTESAVPQQSLQQSIAKQSSPSSEPNLDVIPKKSTTSSDIATGLQSVATTSNSTSVAEGALKGATGAAATGDPFLIAGAAALGGVTAALQGRSERKKAKREAEAKAQQNIGTIEQSKGVGVSNSLGGLQSALAQALLGRR